MQERLALALRKKVRAAAEEYGGLHQIIETASASGEK